MISIYTDALLQELGTELTRVIHSSPLNFARSEPLTPVFQSTYESGLAEQLIVAIRIFVQLHPTLYTNNTPPNIVVNTLLLNLLTQGTLSQLMYSCIIEKLLL